MSNKKSIYFSFFLFVLGNILIFYSLYYTYSLNNKKDVYVIDKDYQKVNNNEMINDKHNIVNIKLSFIGDSLLGSFKGQKVHMNFQDLLDTHDYSYPYKYVYNIFKQDDFTIANGENVFTDKKLMPLEKNHSPAYWYYTDSKNAMVYKESSIEVVSIMNNHSYDYGQLGYVDTKKAINDANLILGDEKPVYLVKNGIKIGVLCINLFHRFQYEECVRTIKQIRGNADYIIIYFHGGTEYKHHPDADIVEYSHGFIDNGADLVIGCHPHVLQPIEVYKDKKIVYSLGSFLFGGTKTLLNRTLIYQMNLEFDLTSNTIDETDFLIPCYLYSNLDGYDSWLPMVISKEDEKQRVLDFMNGLVDTPI